MCMLAKALTPEQWHAYWNVYVQMFGLHALPEHLAFFDALCWMSSTTKLVLLIECFLLGFYSLVILLRFLTQGFCFFDN